jgi:arsenite methyltransferase
VIFSDISQSLLDHCRAAASAEGLLERCRFVLAPADQLAAVGDASVDADITRSVLIYVTNKARAMREFFRVLRPGGRASLFEPINVLMSAADPDLFHGYDVTPVKALAARVEALYASIQPAGADPMVDFDDRDLVRHARDAGFSEIGLELRVTVKNHKDPVPWERFQRMSGNPLQPTFQEALRQVLNAQEADELARRLRPLVESGTGLERTALAYLTAVKD